MKASTRTMSNRLQAFLANTLTGWKAIPLILVATYALAAETDRLSPSQAMQRLTVAEGLQVTTFASDPDIVSISNIDVDSRGRVWACECVRTDRRTSSPRQTPLASERSRRCSQRCRNRERSSDGRQRARALWILAQIEEREDHYIDVAIRDRDPNVRIVGLRIAEMRWTDCVGLAGEQEQSRDSIA